MFLIDAFQRSIARCFMAFVWAIRRSGMSVIGPLTSEEHGAVSSRVLFGNASNQDAYDRRTLEEHFEFLYRVWFGNALEQKALIDKL